jgi:hypothetical protein
MAAVIGASIVLPWAMFYLSIGSVRISVIPLAYVVVTVPTLIYTARTNRVGFLLNSQLAMYLVLPVLVHMSLGGFVNGSGIVMYSSVMVIGALSYAGAKRVGLFFLVLAMVVAALAPFERKLAASAPFMAMTPASGSGGGTAAIVALALDMQSIAPDASIGPRIGITRSAGIDVGPVVAGVIGESRFIYDVYGHTVNMTEP